MVKDTIPHRLFATAKRQPAKPAYYVKQADDWRPTSWSDYAAEVRRAGKALIALGLPPDGKVCMLGFNRPEWCVFHLAAMSVGGAGAGIYTTCSAEEVQYILHNSESLAVLLEDEGQWRKVESQRDTLPHLRYAVMMRGAPKIDDPMVLSWDEFLAKADEVGDAAFDDRLDALEPAGLASLIYTSGTTGPPKGVMLTHENLAWTSKTLGEVIRNDADDSSLSYLPLSHIAEQTATIYGPITVGASVYFAESMEKVADNLREVQPTLVFGVPRVWEKFHARISERLGEATGVKKALITWVRGVCSKRNALLNRGKQPGTFLDLQYAYANRLVLSKLKDAIGLGRATMCISGAAPIAAEVLEFFASIDIVIHEIYGQSEDTGPTSFNLPGKTRFGSVGVALPGVQVKIADDGEILVKGPNVFPGYYKDPEATAETVIDGWLHSGDLGEIDRDGFLRITGRKKEIIITAGGKNITPKNIEAGLKLNRLVNEAVVIGDRRKYLTALVTLDDEAVKSFRQERGIPEGPVDADPALREEVQRAVDEVNSHLARVETIKKFTILPRNFTVETGELTPSLKVKRRIVAENFGPLIEAMYAEDERKVSKSA